MSPLRTIVACTDFSEASHAALIHAGRLADETNAALHILHVITDRVVTDLAEATGTPLEAMREEVRTGAGADLEALLTSLNIAHATITSHIDIGSPFDRINALVHETGADLAVLGVTGEGGNSAGAGTLASACVRKLPISVLLVDQRQVEPFSRILVGVEFSPACALAVQRAAAMARADKAELIVMHVFAGPWRILHYRAPTPEATPAFKLQYTQRLEGKLRSFTEEHAGETGDLSITLALVEHPNYGRTIVTQAKDREADLVVLGTAGRRNLRYMLIGSTAERVLREVPCSMLTIPDALGANVESGE